MEKCSKCGEDFEELFINPNEVTPNNPVCEYCKLELEDELSITWMIDEDPDDFYEHEYYPIIEKTMFYEIPNKIKI